MSAVIHEPEVRWLCAVVECRVCTNQHVSVSPIFVHHSGRTEGGEGLECPKCGAMACDPLDDSWRGEA